MSEYHYFHDAGGALPPNHPTYIERKADSELLNALRAGEFCYILNARQMGKSSLRTRVMKQLELEGAVCTSIDIGTLNTDDQTQWYSSFLSVLIEDFNILDSQEEESWFLENSSRTSNLMLIRFFDNILLRKLKEDKIVIFLDEIDVLISRSFKDDFLRFIRSCYEKRASNSDFNRVVFCLIGVVAPFDLIADAQQTFSFNIGRDIELTELDYNQSKKLLAKGLADKIDNPHEVIKQIFTWTKGQPFLTQKICQLAIENSENGNVNIDDLVEISSVKNWESKSGLIKDHLQNISNCLLSKDRGSDPVSLLILLGQIIDTRIIKYNPHDLQHIQLKLSGAIKIELQNIKIFNQLYSQVFDKSWIQQQLSTLPKSWFPQGNLQEMIYVAPPSKFIQGIVKLIDTKRMIIVTAFCLILVDTLSLYSSYYLAGSPAWIDNFNQSGKGIFIELIRSLFLISFAAFSFNDLFKTETKQILTYDRYWWIRTCLGVLCFLFTIFVCIHNLYLGPKYLSGRQPLPHNVSWFRNYYLPYLYFLPYAIINFVIISIPLISVTIYSSITSISNNIKSIKIFDRSMGKTNNYIKLCSSLAGSDRENINQEMIEAFNRLSVSFLKDFNRYSMLLLGVLLLFVFELTLGKNTLAEATLAITLIDYSFCWVSIIIIFFCGAIEYQKIFVKSCDLLVAIDGNSDEFKNTQNLPRLIRKGILNIKNNKYVYLMMFGAMMFSIILYKY
jgi:AAA-like domain